MIIQTGGRLTTWCTSGRTWTRCRSCRASTCRASPWSSTRAPTATSSPTPVHAANRTELREALVVTCVFKMSIPCLMPWNFLPNSAMPKYFLQSIPTWVKCKISHISDKYKYVNNKIPHHPWASSSNFCSHATSLQTDSFSLFD